MRYLGRKFGLDGSTEAEKIRIDLLEQQVKDFSLSLVMFLFFRQAPPTEQETQEFNGKVAEQLALISKFLGSNQWAAGGDKLSYVDIWLYEVLCWLKLFDAQSAPGEGLLSKFPNLAQFLARIEALPQLADYLKSINTV